MMNKASCLCVLFLQWHLRACIALSMLLFRHLDLFCNCRNQTAGKNADKTCGKNDKHCACVGSLTISSVVSCLSQYWCKKEGTFSIQPQVVHLWMASGIFFFSATSQWRVYTWRGIFSSLIDTLKPFPPRIASKILYFLLKIITIHALVHMVEDKRKNLYSCPVPYSHISQAQSSWGKTMSLQDKFFF